MIEGQTKILPSISTKIKSYNKDIETVIGFKHPSTKFRRD